MALQIGGSANIQGLKLNANPRTGTPMAKIGEVQKTAIPAGSLPKRGRRGGGGNPLARYPKEWIETFNSLSAPVLAFRTLETKEAATPVEAGTRDKLTVRISDGEIHAYNVRGEEVSDVLFLTEPTEEHPDGEQYTGDGVEILEVMANTPVEGPPEAMNRMYQALQVFNKQTGKQLRMLFDHNKMDDKGNIVSQVKVIWRVH